MSAFLKSRSRLCAALVAFAVSAPVYLATMNRTIGFVDRGEMAAVAATLGIAHPTGYPTLTLIGYAATRIVPLPPVLVLNLLAALLTALGLGALATLYDAMLERAAPELGALARAGCATLAALSVGFGAVFWQQANGFEVYALQALLLPLAALFTGDWLLAGGARRAAIAGLLLGLAFTNHGTTIHLLGGLLVLALVGGRLRERLSDLPAALAGGLAGLTPLLYLPLRAAQHPRFSWSEPTTWARFVHHVSGEEFRGWMFSDPRVWQTQSRAILSVLSGELAGAGLLLAAFGAVWLLRRDRAIGLAVSMSLATCAAFASGYGIREIEPYLLTAVVALGALAAAGMAAIAARRVAVAWLAGLLIAGAGFALHRRACDESHLTMVADLTRAQLAPLPRGTLLFNQQWDYTLSPSYYLQAVEGMRTDVVVVDPELLRHPWYVRELARRAPEIVAPVRAQIDAFLASARDYEAGRPYDGARIGVAWTAFTRALVDSSLSRRPIYRTFGTVLPALDRFPAIPEGFAYHVTADTSYRPEPFAPLAARPWHGRADSYVYSAAYVIARARLHRAHWETRHGHADVAALLLRDALRFEPPGDPRRVPPLPLDGNQLVLQSALAFDAVRAMLQSAPPEAAGTGASRGVRRFRSP